MAHGVTSGHNTRDRVRARAVRHQFDQDFPGITGAAPGDRRAAADIAARNMGMVAGAYTARVMMDPASELRRAAAPDAPTFSASHGLLSEHHAFTPAFHDLVRQNHNAREQLKIHTAADLIEAGHGSLVHPAMVAHLAASGNDRNAAVQALHDRQDDPEGEELPLVPPPSRSLFPAPSHPMSLNEMNVHNQANPGGWNFHLIDAPLGIVKPAFKVKKGASAKK